MNQNLFFRSAVRLGPEGEKKTAEDKPRGPREIVSSAAVIAVLLYGAMRNDASESV